MKFYELFNLFDKAPRDVWKEELMKDLVSIDKDNHTCTVKVDGEDFTLDIDMNSLAPDYKCQLEAEMFVKDSKGKQYYVPFFSPMDIRADFASNASAIIDKGDRVELVYLNEGKGCTKALGYKLVYISPDSTEYIKITEEELDSEFLYRLREWWDGKLVI